MTVAVDVILAEVSEPIRFSIEAKARVFHQHERFYKLPRVAVHEGYSLVLEVCSFPAPQLLWAILPECDLSSRLGASVL